jgi:hypothetical protein
MKINQILEDRTQIDELTASDAVRGVGSALGKTANAVGGVAGAAKGVWNAAKSGFQSGQNFVGGQQALSPAVAKPVAGTPQATQQTAPQPAAPAAQSAPAAPQTNNAIPKLTGQMQSLQTKIAALTAQVSAISKSQQSAAQQAVPKPAPAGVAASPKSFTTPGAVTPNMQGQLPTAVPAAAPANKLANAKVVPGGKKTAALLQPKVAAESYKVESKFLGMMI